MDVDEHVIEIHNLVIILLWFSLSIFFTDCTCQNNATYFVLLLFIESRGKNSWHVPHFRWHTFCLGHWAHWLTNLIIVSSLVLIPVSSLVLIPVWSPNYLSCLTLHTSPYFAYTPPKPFPFNSKISITMS